MTTEARRSSQTRPAPVLGATGKIGRRLAARLQALGRPIRIGSRGASPAFDWTHAKGWDACLEGIASVYVNYPSDLPIPGSAKTISALVDRAKRQGVRRLVLLTGRGEDEAQVWEGVVQDSGLEWTIVRASWFHQNFSEGAFVESVRAGQISLPAGDAVEPFVDTDDIADVVVAALTEPGHRGEIYELTGPRLLSFADVASEISRTVGRTIEYQPISLDAFLAEVAASGAPSQVVWTMDYLFSKALDGRNAYLTDGVVRALGRPPKDFSAFAREIAITETWRIVA